MSVPCPRVQCRASLPVPVFTPSQGSSLTGVHCRACLHLPDSKFDGRQASGLPAALARPPISLLGLSWSHLLDIAQRPSGSIQMHVPWCQLAPGCVLCLEPSTWDSISQLTCSSAAQLTRASELLRL